MLDSAVIYAGWGLPEGKQRYPLFNLKSRRNDAETVKLSE